MLLNHLSGFVCKLAARAPLPLACVAVGLLGAPLVAQAASGRISVESNGLHRTATIVEYSRLKRGARATVIVLHGSQSTGGRIRRTLGLDDIALGTSRVMVYPDAVDGHWNRLRNTDGPDDEAFVLALANKLVNEGIADKSKLFVLGYSSGGMLAMKLACDHAGMFAGVAGIATQMPVEMQATCQPKKPVAFMLVNGTADPLVPYTGGKANLNDDKGDVASTDATLDVFAKAAGCSAADRTTSTLPDRDPNDGSRVFLDRVKACRAPIELLRIEGGGHTIPGRRTVSNRGAVVGAQNNDIDSGRLVFEFFRQVAR